MSPTSVSVVGHEVSAWSHWTRGQGCRTRRFNSASPRSGCSSIFSSSKAFTTPTPWAVAGTRRPRASGRRWLADWCAATSACRGSRAMSSGIASSATLATSGYVTDACWRWPTMQRFGARSSVPWNREISSLPTGCCGYAPRPARVARIGSSRTPRPAGFCWPPTSPIAARSRADVARCFCPNRAATTRSRSRYGPG